MAKPGQHQQEPSASGSPLQPKNSGGRQAVVELCEISPSGLVFWSRTRFEIGAQVQVRIKQSALPPVWLEKAEMCGSWVMLKGLVAACPPHRREDGSSGFQVSILVEKDAPNAIRPIKVHSKMNWSTPPMPWLRRFGLN